MAKKCRVCNTRTVGTGTGPGVEGDVEHAKSLGICNICLTEAGWENAHSDHGHDDPEGMHEEDIEELEVCWVCHPDMNLATQDHTPRTGHTNTVAHSRTSHTACHHARTPKDRAACRKAGGAGSEGSLKLFPAPKKVKKA